MPGLCYCARLAPAVAAGCPARGRSGGAGPAEETGAAAQGGCSPAVVSGLLSSPAARVGMLHSCGKRGLLPAGAALQLWPGFSLQWLLLSQSRTVGWALVVGGWVGTGLVVPRLGIFMTRD